MLEFFETRRTLPVLGLMLLASATLYLSARVFSLNLPTWPLEGSWFFNPIAWQLLFAIGLFAGRRLKRDGIGYDARLYAVCLAVMTVALIASLMRGGRRIEAAAMR